MGERRTRLPRIAMAWMIALATAIALDRHVAQWVRDSGLNDAGASWHRWNDLLKAPGEFWFALVVAGLLYLTHGLRWRASLLLLAGATLSGSNSVFKWVVGRTRPFKLFDADGLARLAPFELDPFRGGIAGAFHQTNLSFPSGHAACAFATAAALSILLPRWRWSFYAVAAMVAIERVASNAHWLSDVVAAAALGVGSTHLVKWLWCIRQRRLSTELPPQAAEPPDQHGRTTVPVAGDPGV